MFGPLVVPLDGSRRAEKALPVAAALRDHCQGDLELVMARPFARPSRRARDYLARTAERWSARRVHLLTGHPTRAQLIDLARHRDATFCMASPGQTGGRDLLGSVAAEIVNATDRAALLVGPEFREDNAEPESIIAYLDGSDASEQILPSARSWSEEFELRPWLFQVAAPGAYQRDESSYLRRVRRAHHWPAVEWDVGHSADPAVSIAAFARTLPAPVIALTTSGRTRWGRGTLGKLARDVVRRAPGPILLRRPIEAAEPARAADSPSYTAA